VSEPVSVAGAVTIVEDGPHATLNVN